MRSIAKCGTLAVCACALIMTAGSGSDLAATKEHTMTEVPTAKIIQRSKATVGPTIVPTAVPTAIPTENPKILAEEEYFDSLEELAICVEAEAGNQGLLGKRMVACVILNRVDDKDWPNTIQGVIEQKYHFASYWNGAMERTIPTEETYKAVSMELKERSYPGLFYFTAEGYGDYGTPWGKVGDHYFCTK